MTAIDDLASARGLFAPAPGTVYLDTATYGLPPRPTIDAVQGALRAWQEGTGSWREDWDEPTDACRVQFARLIGARPETIARMPASSVGVGLVAARLGPGDEVVVPDDELTSTLFPLLVAARRGVRVREVPLDALAESIRPGTTLVATSLVQMQTGRMADLAAITEQAAASGAKVLIDGTQGIPFVRLEPFIDRIDYLVCSAYKHLLSPRGVAFLYVREDRWEELEPLHANWRAADRPFERYFGGPLTLAPDAGRFDVSLAWFSWLGALASLRLLSGWRATGVLDIVVDLARGLADRVGVPFSGSTLVSVPIVDVDGARAALAAAGVKAAVRGAGLRLSPHVYTTPEHIEIAAEVIRPFVSSRDAKR